jgi:hypothetical protein
VKITAVETIRTAELPNILWVHVHTDEGLTGLGETFFIVETVETYIHECVAPRLVGQDPSRIDALARDLVGYLGFRSTGAETRGNSAISRTSPRSRRSAFGQIPPLRLTRCNVRVGSNQAVRTGFLASAYLYPAGAVRPQDASLVQPDCQTHGTGAEA